MADMLCENTKMAFEVVAQEIVTLREAEKASRLNNINLKVLYSHWKSIMPKLHFFVHQINKPSALTQNAKKN